MSPLVVGRSAEVARLAALLDAVGRGKGGAVAIVGAPGSGRTTLLDRAAADGAARGFVVRRAAGRRAERHVPGALAHELLGRPVHDPAEVLAGVQALAVDRPVVVAIDDLHLADDASAAACAYAARRLVGTRVALLLGMGGGPVPAELDLGGVDQMVLDGLDPGGVAELFERCAGALAPAALDRVVELTGGNPLAVVDLARRSSPEQRAGSHPFSDLPEVSEALITAFAEPLRTLPESARWALCVAAAEPTGRLDVVAGALRRLDAHVDSLEAAEALGVVRLADGRVWFDHPMRRVVAYASLAVASRRAVHRALAGAWTEPGDAPHRVRHMVAGSVGPDDGVADDVQLLAEHLQRTGRAAEAADAWQAAAGLSVDASRRRLREARAAQAREAAAAEAPPTGAAAPAGGPLAALSPAELRVAKVIAEGLTNRQVAERLFVSAKTVDAHLQSIFRKLALNTRAQLAVAVTRHAPGSGGYGS